MTAIATPDNAVNWRSTAGEDNPAGPLFGDEYAEADLALQDPMAFDCSMATGSRTMHCCA